MLLCFRTNLPVEVMNYLDYPIKTDRSYVKGSDILNYLQDYAEQFKLKQHIKVHFIYCNCLLLHTHF